MYRLFYLPPNKGPQFLQEHPDDHVLKLAAQQDAYLPLTWKTLRQEPGEIARCGEGTFKIVRSNAAGH